MAAVIAGCEREAPLIRPLEDRAGQVGELEHIPNIVELPGDRIAFADPANQALLLVDRRTGAITRVGRPGNGPGEFIQPMQVERLGERLAVFDRAQGRISFFTLAGAHLTDSAIPRPLRGEHYSYSQDGRILMGRLDSVPQTEQVAATLGWYDLASSSFVPITRVATQRWLPVPEGPPRLNGLEQFGASDLAGLTPDGTVWIARADPQHVEWITQAGWDSSPPLEIERVPSVAAEQKVERFRGREFRLPMAPIKGPFSRAAAGPDGEVWLELHGPHMSPTTTLMVVPPRGRGIRRYSVPAGRELRTVGERWVYFTFEDADGFTVLEWRARPFGE
jgi:hypothetical protein